MDEDEVNSFNFVGWPSFWRT